MENPFITIQYAIEYVHISIVWVLPNQQYRISHLIEQNFPKTNTREIQTTTKILTEKLMHG